MKFNEHASCPCGSGKLYMKCCKIFHDGENPNTALELMKSRFSAFAVGNSEYVMSTTHQDNTDYSTDSKAWKNSIEEVIESTDFNSVKILDFIDGPDEAYVTFKLDLKQQSLDVSFTEMSKFLRVDGKWLYLSGEFLD